MFSGIKISEYEAERADLIKRVRKELEHIGRLRDRIHQCSIKKEGTIVVLFLIFSNLIFFHFIEEYIEFWIISSFIFLMLNPFLMLLPAGHRRHDRKPLKTAIHEIRENVKQNADILYHERSDISEIGWNIFFLNTQPLAPGFIFIFTINIILSVYGGLITNQLRPGSVIVVVFVSFMIMLFYAVIQYKKPYSPGFFGNLLMIPSKYHHKRDEGLLPAFKFAFFIAIASALSGIVIISAFFHPRLVLEHVMISEKIIFVEISILIIIVIFISQLLLVRFMQSRYSMMLMLGMCNYITHLLEDIILKKLIDLPESLNDMSEEEKNGYIEKLLAIKVDIAKTMVYRHRYRTRFGLFPVFFIYPDIDLIVKKGLLF